MIKQACILALFTFSLLFSKQLKAQTYNIAVEKAKTVQSLAATLRSQPLDSICTFVGYTLIVMPQKGNPYQVQSMGKGVAAADLKYHLPQLQAGDVMQFSRLLIQCGTEKMIPELRNITLNLN
jgi:hypothetical protein